MALDEQRSWERVSKTSQLSLIRYICRAWLEQDMNKLPDPTMYPRFHAISFQKSCVQFAVVSDD